MTCEICYGTINALKELDIEVSRIAEELAKVKNVDGLHWLMIARSAAEDHEWGNLTYRAWVLNQVAQGINVIPLLWKIDSFAKKHEVDLKEGS